MDGAGERNTGAKVDQKRSPTGALRSISYDMGNDNTTLLFGRSPAQGTGAYDQRMSPGRMSNGAPLTFVKRGSSINPGTISLTNQNIEDMARKFENGQDSTLGKVISDQVKVHNPITNPLSYVNQNPYVQKQMEEAKSKKVLDFVQSP